MQAFTPGLIALFGSGETAPTSGVVYDELARRAGDPLRISILETPAGFQPNSVRVAGKVAEFLQQRLQNYRPQIELVAARERNTTHSPDDPAISAGLQAAGIIFLGPGSPTYTVRQLSGSLAWQRLVARQRQGTALATASAATIAIGCLALPVYEIYKVGEALHWQAGLDLLGPYGLPLVLLPHWNNAEGGAELDTSRCYMGQERYERLLALLPPAVTVVGIDEHTGLLLDLAAGSGRVLGRGGVTVRRAGAEQRFARGTTLPLSALGAFRLPAPEEGIDPAVWRAMATSAPPAMPTAAPAIPQVVYELVEQRQAARTRRDWAAADVLRQQIAEQGWQVRDTPAGPVIEPAGR